MAGIISYYCERCRRNRKSVILPDEHSINLAASSNGLVSYSDLHPCRDDILGVSNIQTDEHYNARQVEYMKLPKTAILMEEEPTPLIPAPSAGKEGNIIIISDLLPNQNLRFTCSSKEFNYQIRVGKISMDAESIAKLTSKNDNIKFEYFVSDIEWNPNLQSWISEFLDTLEQYPPVKLGLILEVLIYIFEHSTRQIEEIDRKLMKEVFYSHLTKVELLSTEIEAALQEISQEFNDNLVAQMKMIVAELDLKNNTCNIYEMAGLFNDVIQLILNLYLLEKLGIINVDRSKQDNQGFDKEIRESIVS